MRKDKGNLGIAVLIVAIVIIVFGSLGYFYKKSQTKMSVVTPDPVAVVKQFLGDEGKGDIKGALALMTDNAVIEGLGLCAKTPCKGKEAITKELERSEAGGTEHTKIDLTASGNIVNGRIEHQNDQSRSAGIDRFIVLTTTTLRDNKIALIQRKFDTSDPQTVTFINFLKK